MAAQAAAAAAISVGQSASSQASGRNDGQPRDPAGFPGRAAMRAEQAVLADRIAHGNLACIDRFNLLAQMLAVLDGHRLPIGESDPATRPRPLRQPLEVPATWR